jgi:hypothetical protein
VDPPVDDADDAAFSLGFSAGGVEPPQPTERAISKPQALIPIFEFIRCLLFEVT